MAVTRASLGIFVSCSLWVAGVVYGWTPQDAISDLQTVAESSDYTATSQYRDVLEFVDRCCDASHVTRYDFGESVEGRAMVATIIANPPFQPDWLQASDRGTADPAGNKPADPSLLDPRLRILLLGNIHSGECAGKEALLAMLRELAVDPEHSWLADCVVLIVPNYNVDANERVGLDQRPGQIGPSQGMGQRENAMQLDLNRDFCKMESPEARALVKLVNDFDPHMFIDCHTTNGSRHQYVLTYDTPHNPTTPTQIRDYLRNNMMPQVTRKLEDRGVLTFYYGNFSRDNTQWSTYGHEPRYSTEYIGLRGRLGILSEAYSYATYRDRIAATRAFVGECIEHVRDNADDVKQLLTGAHMNPQPGELVHVDSQMVAFPEKVTIRGWDGQDKRDYEVTFLGDYKPVTSVTLPEAYALPPEMSRLVERMQRHGVEISRLSGAKETNGSTGQPAKVPGKAYQVKTISRSARPFQKHNMVKLEVAANLTDVQIPADSFIIRTRQPLGRLVSYMLEPETNEGLVTWNFLDRWLQEGQPYPIYRIETDLFSTQIVDQVEPGGRLKLSDIFGPEKLDLPDVTLDQVPWSEDGGSYFVEKNGRRVRVDAASGGETRIALPFDTAVLAAALREIDGPNRAELLRLLNEGIPLRGAEQTLFLMGSGVDTFVFDSVSQQAIRLGTKASPAELAELNPAGNAIAFVQDHNLMLLRDIAADPIPLTSDGSTTVLNGKLDWVYQEELYGRGNFKGFWWSPQGDAVAWLRTDESPVPFYTVMDHIPVRGQQEVTAYPKAGDPLPRVNLAIHRLESGQTVSAQLPEVSPEPLNEHLISRVTWEPSGKSLLVQVQNRIQSWLDLCRCQADSGELTVLFRDETPAWIETPGDPVFLADGSFLWLSPRSGQRAIYGYSQEGIQLTRLTNVAWEVRELLGCDEKNGWVYFTGCPERPTQVAVLRVKLDGSNLSSLTQLPGTLNAKFNRDYSYFLVEQSTATQPDELLLCEAGGTVIRHVIPNRDDRLGHLAIADPEFFQIPIGEEDNQGTLDAMLIKPVDFQADKKYPVLVHVYGGPQAPRVRNRFGGQSYLWHQYLAQQGLVVLIVDNRSSSFRSTQQVWPIYRDLARRELADIDWAVAWLTQYNGWVDPDRIGIWGWSYGGYMTAYALTHSKLYRCGIAGAPVTDWRNYDAIYTERYMDTPQANPDGYQASSVLNAAENLQGRLLLIHGTVDDNVHLSNTLQLAKALQTAGHPFELMVYPENRHAVRVPEQRLHLHQLMTDFLKRNLQPESTR